MESNKSGHLGILDILRGVAASLVCLFHFTGGHLPKLTNQVTKPLFLQGGVGVYIFFVISGFIIPYVLVKINYNLTVKNFSTFIFKRIVRICPPSYFSVLLLVFEWIIIDILFDTTTRYMDYFSIEGLIANLLYVAPFFDLAWFNGIFWTLSVEFQYYLFLGLFFSFIFKNNLTLAVSSIVLSCVVLLSSFSPHDVDSVSRHLFINYYLFFAIGFITMQYRGQRINKFFYFGLVGILGIVALIKFNFIISIAAVLTSFAISFLEFNNKPLEFLVKISYSLYLTHMISGSAFEGVITKLFYFESNLAKLTMQFLAFMFSIGCAYLFYIVIEKPFIKLSSRFSKRPDPQLISVTNPFIVK